VHKTLRKLLYALALAAAVTALSAAGLASGAFAGFQHRASDALFPSAQTDPRIMVVVMDVRSEQALNINPRDPWPRAVQAEIAQRLAQAGVSVGVWDVVFPGTSPVPGDDAFRAALSEVPAVVLAETAVLSPGPTGSRFWRSTPSHEPADIFTALPNVHVALAEVVPDPTDNVVRNLPLLVDERGRFTQVPTLSLAALQALRGTLASPSPDGVHVGSRVIPTDPRHTLRLNWSDDLTTTGSPSVISAIDLIDGNVDPARLRGRIVFVGDTDPLHHDFQFTPVNKSGDGLPGVLIHANALNTMLTASYLTPVSNAEATAWSGGLALIVGLAVLFLPLWASLLISLLLIGLPPLVPGAYLLVSYTRFDAGHVMNILYPLTAVVLTFFGGLAVRYVTETRQRRRVSSLFAQYVPEAAAKQLEESGALESHIEGERVDVGLFFCDLRGFTSLSATLEPSQVRAMLNQFYDLLTEIIHAHGGTVLKFVGDEVFAVFGAPLPCENNAQATLDCAIEIQERAPELDAQLADLGIPPVKFGIGMNAGPVVAAHIGGGRRRQYDIVGDTVNLGSRLCGQAGKGEIVLPESMIDKLTVQPPMESMGAVQLKGLEQPVPLFKVTVGESEPRQAAPAVPAPSS
jgi:adenylate cyclase